MTLVKVAFIFPSSIELFVIRPKPYQNINLVLDRELIRAEIWLFSKYKPDTKEPREARNRG